MHETLRYIGVAIILGFVPIAVWAQEEQTSILYASGWCVVKAHKPTEDMPSDDTNDTEEPDSPESVDGLEPFSGCDIGVALSLYRLRRLAWVVVLGSKSLGTGLAWVVSRPDVHTSGPVIAIAIGIVARYDSGGVYVGEVYPALGATLSFGRAAPGASP